MAVKAKFKCDSITEYLYSKEANCNAVYGKEGENADFTKATPSGNLKISIAKDVPASDFFEVGKEFYLTFEKVE